MSVPPEKMTLCPCIGGQRQEVSVHGGKITGQYDILLQPETENWLMCFKVKVKAVCGSYSTATLRHIVLLPE